MDGGANWRERARRRARERAEEEGRHPQEIYRERHGDPGREGHGRGRGRRDEFSDSRSERLRGKSRRPQDAVSGIQRDSGDDDRRRGGREEEGERRTWRDRVRSRRPRSEMEESSISSSSTSPSSGGRESLGSERRDEESMMRETKRRRKNEAGDVSEKMEFGAHLLSAPSAYKIALEKEQLESSASERGNGQVPANFGYFTEETEGSFGFQQSCIHFFHSCLNSFCCCCVYWFPSRCVCPMA